MHYQAVLWICYISDVLNDLFLFAMKSDNDGKESYIKGKVKIFQTALSNWLLFGKAQEKEMFSAGDSVHDKYRN